MSLIVGGIGVTRLRPLGAGAVAALALLCCALVQASPAPAAQKRPEPLPEHPNIVVIMTDDQQMMWKEGEKVWLRRKIMPQTYRLFDRGGTVFNDFAVTTPVCCPSRAGFLTGQYGHNSGVLANKPGYAGLIDPGNVLPVWLRRSGYRTALVGKWLHGYAETTGDFALPAPGWQRWAELLTFNRYYGYEMSVDGRRVSYGTGNNDYVTRVLSKRALGWVREYAHRAKPLFLWLSHMAPHSAKARPNPCRQSALPERQDYGLFSEETLPLPESFNEADVSDKPTYIQERPVLDETQVADLARRYRCQLASLRSVDRSTKQLLVALEDAGELRNTVFVFTSDNGLFMGEHRLRSGKGLPYDEAVQVPLAIRVPAHYLRGGEHAQAVDAQTANIDLAPTILKLAGAQPCAAADSCRAFDGRSLLPLIEGRTPSWAEDRTIVIEQQNEAPGVDRRRDFGPCTYWALRTPTEVYIENTSVLDTSLDPAQCVAQSPPITEHYSRVTDPFQIQNLFNRQSGATQPQALLSQRLAELRTCAGNSKTPVPGRTPCP